MAEDGIQTLEALGSRVRSCTQCPLCRSRTQAVPGEGPAEASIVLVGEAPGRREDAAGRPFVGAAGRVLEQALASAGLRREAVFVSNVVKCRPPSNRAPKGPEVAACRPYLVALFAAIRPALIVALATTSERCVLVST